MQHYQGNGSLKPKTRKHNLASSSKVGSGLAGSHQQIKSLKPKTRTQSLRQSQQLQHGVSSKEDVLLAGKASRARQGLKTVSPPGGIKQKGHHAPKGKVVKRSPAYVPSFKQKQHQSPQTKKQLRTQKLNTQAKRKAGSGGVSRTSSKDDLQRAELVRVKSTLCSEGFICQKFAYKPKVKKSKEICLRMLEEIDAKTGKRDYRLSWSKPKKSFSIISELKSITRGFDASPVLQRNQSILRNFTILGKHALKSHCISFNFRDRSLDLVFKQGETAESLEKLVNFIRTNGSL